MQDQLWCVHRLMCGRFISTLVLIMYNFAGLWRTTILSWRRLQFAVFSAEYAEHAEHAGPSSNTPSANFRPYAPQICRDLCGHFLLPLINQEELQNEKPSKFRMSIHSLCMWCSSVSNLVYIIASLLAKLFDISVWHRSSKSPWKIRIVEKNSVKHFRK